MAWEALGTVTVGEDWASFPVLVTDSETIRLVHLVTPSQGTRVAHLAQFYSFPPPGGRSGRWMRIYSGPDPTILALPIPDEIRATGTATYALQVKARWPFQFAPWQIQAEAFY